MSVAAADADVTISPGVPGYRALRVGEIRGGSNTNPLWLSNVTNEDLRSALESSLRNIGYLAESGTKESYVVTASIVNLDRPAGAMDPVLVIAPVKWAVTAKIRYTVTPSAGGQPVFDDLVAATGESQGGLAASARVKSASEAAIRANFQAFARRLRTEWR